MAGALAATLSGYEEKDHIILFRVSHYKDHIVLFIY